MGTLLDEFSWRGLVYDATDGVSELLAEGPVTAYIGFDPTASSLHVGSLLPIMALSRLQRLGHNPIAVVGGGTGMIGDPSGKSQERVLQSAAQIEANLVGIRVQLERFLRFDGPNAARIVNNADWLAPLDLMSFLRDTGKHFTVNYMLQKDSVNRRLASEDGISYTEFSYLLLQAFDFLQLFDRHGCRLQMGGSDQWGNITAGTDLIRKLRGKRAYGLVMPLVLTASGAKFGKSEAGTVWLAAERTSPYDFYQYWFNTDDRDVVNYLRYFTFLTKPEIDELDEGVRQAPERRAAQRRLADEVTRLVHGHVAAQTAQESTAAMFGGRVRNLSPEDMLKALGNVSSSEVTRAELGEGVALTDRLVRAGLASSKSEAVRLIRGGGIYVNDGRVTDERKRLTLSDAVNELFLVLRKGAKHQHLIKVAP
jgi:tyrosyl-tRNA synthetase